MLTQTPPDGGTGTGSGGERKPDPKARKCRVCKKLVTQKDDGFWKNEKNASTCPSWWKTSMYDNPGSMSSADVVSWNNKNRFTIKPHKLHLHNYWTPLSGQVEAPAPLQPPIPPKTLNNITNTPANTVSFQLPINHIEKDSTAWRRSPQRRSRYTRRREENPIKNAHAALNLSQKHKSSVE